MQKIQKRRAKEVIRERDKRIVSDYAEGYSIEQILQRNNINSPQTIYNAIERVNNLLEQQEGSLNDSSR